MGGTADQTDGGITGTLARWIAGFSLDDLPDAVCDQAKKCLLDGIGVAIAGSGRQTSAQTADTASRLYGPGPCSVLPGTFIGLAPPGAALANGTAGHVLDFDDTSYTGIFHATAVCWPAALAAAELEGISGRRLLEAFIAGVETSYALAEWLGTSIYFDGWWTTPLIGQPGAAAAVAKAKALDESRTAAAIEVAIATAMGMRSVFGTAAKPVGVGIAARQGLEAAYLAASGVEADDRVITGEQGWLHRLGVERPNNARIDGVGRRFGLIDPGILFKRYPVCSAAHAAVDAASEIAEALEPKADQIDKVECLVTPLVATSLKYADPSSAEEAQFSLPFTAATALLDRTVTVEHLARSSWNEPRTRDLMARVSMIPSPDLGGHLDRTDDGPEGAVVTVRLKNGQDCKLAKPVAYGMPENPMSAEDLSAKFRACCLPVLGSERCERLHERIVSLEAMACSTELFADLLTTNR